MKKIDGTFINTNEWIEVFEHIKNFGEHSIFCASIGSLTLDNGAILYSRLMAKKLLENTGINMSEGVFEFINKLDDERIHANEYLQRLEEMRNMGVTTIEFVPNLSDFSEKQTLDVRGKVRKVFSDGKFECEEVVSEDPCLTVYQTKVTGASWCLVVENDFNSKNLHMKTSTFCPDLSDLTVVDVDSYKINNGFNHGVKNKKKKKK